MNTETTIRSELESDETLLWHGQPRQGLVWRQSDWVFAGFGLFFLAFVAILETILITGGEASSLLGIFFGLFFLLSGLYMFPGKLLLDVRTRRRTFYGLTDRRAIIVSGRRSATVKSLLLKTLKDVSVEQKRDGSGTIFFGQKGRHDAMYAGTSGPGFELTPRFELIPDVREVYRLLQRDG